MRSESWRQAFVTPVLVLSGTTSLGATLKELQTLARVPRSNCQTACPPYRDRNRLRWKRISADAGTSTFEFFSSHSQHVPFLQQDGGRVNGSVGCRSFLLRGQHSGVMAQEYRVCLRRYTVRRWTSCWQTAVPRRFIGLIVVGLLQRWADTCRLARRSCARHQKSR